MLNSKLKKLMRNARIALSPSLAERGSLELHVRGLMKQRTHGISSVPVLKLKARKKS